MLPETTPVALTNVLLDKFNELKHVTGEPQKQKQVPLAEGELLYNNTSFLLVCKFYTLFFLIYSFMKCNI